MDEDVENPRRGYWTRLKQVYQGLTHEGWWSLPSSMHGSDNFAYFYRKTWVGFPV